MEKIKDDYRVAQLSPPDQAMLDFAVKLTHSPSQMSPDDVKRLREQGFGDEAILEITQITGYFNYINRVADALGVDPEPNWGAERTRRIE